MGQTRKPGRRERSREGFSPSNKAGAGSFPAALDGWGVGMLGSLGEEGIQAQGPPRLGSESLPWQERVGRDKKWDFPRLKKAL